MALSRPFKQIFYIASSLLQAIDAVMSLALLVPAGSVSSTSTLQIFRDASHGMVTVAVALSHPFKEDCLHRFISPRPSPPADRWCDVLGFACAHRQCLKFLNISDLPRRKPLHSDCCFAWPVCLLSRSPALRRV